MSHPKVWEYLRSKEGGRRYVAKYASKPYQKEVPSWFRDIGRFWGVSKGVAENRETPEIIELTEDELREYLREKDHNAANFDVVPKYLWGVSNPLIG